MTPPTLRVLSVVWNLIRGGTEGQCARTALAHTAAGNIHRVAAFRREGFFLAPVESACGPVHDFGIRKMASLDTLRRIRTLAALLRSERIQLLHAWDIDASIFASHAARLARIPYLTSRRDLAQIYPPHKLWLMARADRRAARVIINAEAIRPVARAAGVADTAIRLVPNILDLPEFDRLAHEPPPAGLPHAPIAVMVARLDPEKDADTFLRALANARRQTPALRGVLAGDGIERARLESLARELGLADAVTFLGDVKAVPALLRRCAIGVLTPRANEGLSNTLLEYMAAGLPVIATDCGGNRELIRDDLTGFIAPPGDHAALAARLVQLAADPDLANRLGARGRAAVTERHTPAGVAAQFDAIYRKVLGHA